ncbi:hypothetical protein IJT10_06075 [bacterium]|nr:hypothetical protein [bacterium]
MTKKSSRKDLLNFLVSAGLCLSIGAFASGCGDSGNTSSNPLPVPNYGSVIFNYDNISAILAKVRYAAYNRDGKCLGISHMNEIDGGSFSFTLNNVHPETAYINAYYFSADDQLLCCGRNAIEWNVTEHERFSTVDNPDFSLDAQRLTSVEAYPMPAVIDKGEVTEIKLTGYYSLDDQGLDEGNFDLTPLISVEAKGKIITTPEDSYLQNKFKAVSYGTQYFDVTANGLDNYYNGEELAVHVTDAVLESITLQDEVTEETNKVTILHPDIDLGITPMTYNGENLNIRRGRVSATGHYVTHTAGAPSPDVLMRSEDLTWSTPNVDSIGYTLRHKYANYTSKKVADNVVLYAKATNKEEKEIEGKIKFNIISAEVRTEQEIQPLQIGNVDYAATHQLPLGYEFSFKMNTYYVFTEKEQQVSTDVVQVTNKNSAGTLSAAIDNVASGYPTVSVDEQFYTVDVATGDMVVGDEAQVTLQLIDSEELILASANNPYSFKVVEEPAEESEESTEEESGEEESTEEESGEEESAEEESGEEESTEEESDEEESDEEELL